jgi:hypothetical protein
MSFYLSQIYNIEMNLLSVKPLRKTQASSFKAKSSCVRGARTRRGQITRRASTEPGVIGTISVHFFASKMSSGVINALAKFAFGTGAVMAAVQTSIYNGTAVLFDLGLMQKTTPFSLTLSPVLFHSNF